MDSRQLKYFSAVYEHETLARSSDYLHIAVSALSYHISNLEGELGVKLFTRIPRGMRPTAAGERLYLHAFKIIQLMETAKKDMQSTVNHLYGEVSVSMSYSIIKILGVSLAKEILTQYPNILLILKDSLSGFTIDHMVSAKVDIAFAYNPPLTSALKLTPILNENMVLIGHKSIIGEQNEPIDFKEILKMPLFLLGKGISSQVVFSDSKILTAIKKVAIMHLFSVSAVQNMILAKLGCVIGPIAFIDKHDISQGIHYREIINPVITRNLYACEISDRVPTYAFEVIKSHIYQLIYDSIKSEKWKAKNLIKI